MSKQTCFQISMIRKKPSYETGQEMKAILRRNLSHPKKISISICNKITEFPIESDYNPEKLRKKSTKQEKLFDLSSKRF